MSNTQTKIQNLKSELKANTNALKRYNTCAHYLRTAQAYVKKNKVILNPIIMAMIFNKVSKYSKGLSKDCQLSNLVNTSHNSGIFSWEYKYQLYQLKIDNNSDVQKLFVKSFESPNNKEPDSYKKSDAKQIIKGLIDTFQILSVKSLNYKSKYESHVNYKLNHWGNFGLLSMGLSLASGLVFMLFGFNLLALMLISAFGLFTVFDIITSVKCFHYAKWNNLIDSHCDYRPANYIQFSKAINQALEHANGHIGNLIKTNHIIKSNISDLEYKAHKNSVPFTMKRLKLIDDKGNSWNKLFSKTKKPSKAYLPY